MMPSDTHKIVIHVDKTPDAEYARRFNAPTIEEGTNIAIGDQLIKVTETHRYYDTMQYAIIIGLCQWTAFQRQDEKFS